MCSAKPTMKTFNGISLFILEGLLLSNLSSCFIVSSTKKATSFSLERAKLHQFSERQIQSERAEDIPIRVVVVGGGWAGFTAADALATCTSRPIQIHLLDASPRGQGGLAGGWRSAVLQRPVETGLHGFWREYLNTFATLERIGLNADDILTPFTPSILTSASGKLATAPVLGSRDEAFDLNNVDWKNPSKILENIASLLPPPLDLALLSDFAPNSPLSVADRISAIGLLGAWADFGQDDPVSWERYDKFSAEKLFLTLAGISPTLYRELVTPLLHVLPMTPGYDCSAAAALSCFHVFALQSRGAFDVRWCRGTIAEKIFDPWATKLQGSTNVDIRGSSKVTSIDTNGDKYTVVVNGDEKIECDAVVMAVGGTAMKRLISSCPPFQVAPVSKIFQKLRGVTCVAVRLFLRPNDVITSNLAGGSYDSSQLPPDMANAMKDSPVIVCGPRIGGIPELAEAGFCIYDLQRLHDEFSVGASGAMQTCAAIEVDFFRADAIADMKSDNEITDLVLRAVAAALNVRRIDKSAVLDASVVRARNAVSHFCVDSASASPGVKLEKGLYMCGDWVDRTGHASWSTEKAVVTGRQAIAALSQDFQLDCLADILPVAEDTVQLAALRKIAKTLRVVTPSITQLGTIPTSPWVMSEKLGLR